MEPAEPVGLAGTGGSQLTCVLSLAAGRTTTSEELEDMLESGNPAIFSSGVRTACQPWSKPGTGKSRASPLVLGGLAGGHAAAVAPVQE